MHQSRGRIHEEEEVLVQRETSALVGEKMPINVESQGRGQAYDDLFARDLCSLHLVVEMWRGEEGVLGEEGIG